MSVMTPTISNLPKVSIGGATLPNTLAAALGDVWVESNVNLPAAFHITFRVAAEELMKQFSGMLKIGAPATVYAVADREGDDKPLITGLVTAIETEWTNRLPTTVVRGLDSSFKMLRQRRATGYLNMTAGEIVAKLAAQDGVEIGTIQPTTPPYQLLTQPNVSDWEFVQYLAGQSGMEAYVDYQGRLQFRKPGPTGAPVMLDFEEDVLHCRTGVTAADQVSQVTTRGWNVDQKMLLLGKAPAVSSTEYHIETTPGEATAPFGTATLTETGTPYDTQAEVDQAANSLAADITSAFAEMELEVRGWPDLAPGSAVVLDGAGKPFDGTYTVTATRHAFGQDNLYSTWVWVTGRQVRTLYGLAAAGEAQPRPRIPGVVNAIVTDINDPTSQGRVKLKFPWFDDTYVTDWVRTVQFGGYKGGGVISPEVQDEVLVAFDRGSMDHPYVLGGLYSNPQNSPSPHDTPLYTGGVLNRRSLVSRKGQRLELLDAEAEAKTGVRLQSGDKALTVFLDQTNTTITVSSNGQVAISGKTDVTITGDASVSVKSSGSVSVNAPKVNITGDVTIQGATQIAGDVNITGVLTQEGESNFTGSVSIEGAVDITGDENVIGIITQDGTPVL
jgi:phage protein D/phage baseplate assembly protein gpV